VPADPLTIDGKSEAGAKVAAFSTAAKAGLFKVDLLEGRASKDESKKKSSEQEGLDTPIPVKPEFAFSVRSRLPLAASGDAHAQMTGEIDLPLCEKNDNQSTLTVDATKINDPNVEVLPLDDWFPAAQFGDALVHENERLQHRINQLHDRVEATLKQALRFAAGQNEIAPLADPSAQANLIMSFITGRWHQYAKSGFKRDPMQYWNEQWSALLAA